MALKLPESVLIGECVVREGCQHEEHYIPAQAKIWLINQLNKAGFKKIEVTNLSNPKYVPQFRDADEVLQGIKRLPDVTYTAVTVVQSAVERAVDVCEKGYGPTEIVNMVSTSESHCQRNMGKSSDELLKLAGEWVQLAHGAGMKFCGCIGTVFGCPMEGPVPIEKAFEFADRLIEYGVDSVMYGDTTGEGTPSRALEFYSEIVERYPDMIHIAHFHDSRGWGPANCFAALQAGVRHFDSSMGGIGGQPASVLDRVPVPGTGKLYTPSDITGNVRSEDLIVMIDEMGIDTGLDVDRVLEIGRAVEMIFGRRLRSYCVETGRIPKGKTGR
ncbi:MAG: hydroxymethylglutaryl-CoA lyase [Deltaproteobacteria bacterium]|nr:hydroxymethylglutaryl-CoA lyase [Deltaproteobacteria bacterium]